MAAEIPLSLRTAYAELLERCAAAEFEQAFAEEGVFTPKTIRGRRYWYFQVSANGTRKQRYVGAETGELLERIARHKQVRDDLRERQTLVSALVRSAHLPRPDPAAGAVLSALAEAGVFRLRAVLVGTVAFQTYSAMLGARLPVGAVQTADVDIAQDYAISVAVADAIPNMLGVLRGADPSFRPLPYAHEARRTATYATRGLRVDFLATNRDAERDAPVKLKALGTDALPLRFLDFLIRDPVPAVVLHRPGVYALVPAPERFALHKLIVSRRRQGGHAKADKDLLQAQALLGVLANQRESDLRAAWGEVLERGRKWTQLLLDGLHMVDPTVRDVTLKALGRPRNILADLALRFDASAMHYDFERDVAVFTGLAGNHPVRCAISREALDDHFAADGLDGKGRLGQARKHRDAIEELAAIKYRDWPIEEAGSTLIRTQDVAQLLRERARASRRRSRKPLEFRGNSG